MKLGLLAADLTYIEKAARFGFSAIELTTDPFGDPGQGDLDGPAIARAADDAALFEIEITALAYYGMAFAPPPEDAVELAYERVFDAAVELGVTTIASMSGFDARRDWVGNLDVFSRRFGNLALRAEERGLRIALENWIGFGGHLPFRPINMGGSPGIWSAWFERVHSPALGIEFDPSHLLGQGIDPVRALREFAGRIYHVHAKDVEALPEERYLWGVNGDTTRFRIPGDGAVDWPEFVAALDEIGYTGGIAIEHEDSAYAGEQFDEGFRRGWEVLHPLVYPTIC